MNTELVKAAGAEAPELMEKIAAALAELESNPEELADTLQEMAEVVDRAEGKAKTAGFFKDIGVGATKSVATTIATGLGLAVATDLYNRARRGLTRGSNWKNMMEANPHLKEKDLKQVRTAFAMVQKHAPDVASDPLAAGALVDNVVGVGDMPSAMHKQMETMVELQKRKAETMYEPFKSGPKVEFKNVYEQPKVGGGKG